MGLVRTIEPAIEPVELQEAKDQLRLLDANEDTLVSGLIVAAREYLEVATRRTFIESTWELALDEFPPGVLEVERPRLRTVVKIDYVDSSGVTQTWPSAEYSIDTTSEPGRILPEPSTAWPTVETGRMNAVLVEYTAGYGTLAADVPQALRHAVLLLAAHYFESRIPIGQARMQAPIPWGIEALIWAHRWGDYPR